MSSNAHCAAVSAAALLVAASTFGIYKVSTLAGARSMVLWQERSVSVMRSTLSSRSPHSLTNSAIHR